MERIYLDHAATTPVLREALDAMSPWQERSFGNPSSLYAEGQEARQAIDEARETLSRLLGCLFAEVIFTSSGTEAANLAIIGTALAHTNLPRKRLLMGAAEHHCVLHTKPLLEGLGFEVQTVRVDRQAVLDLNDLEAKLGDDVLLTCVMHANNELGTIQPVRETADLARGCGSLFFCDAVQTFGVMEWTVDDLKADLIALSAHKVYGPKGAGVLYVRGGTKVKPIALGGGQERDLRAGTENVAGIVGFAKAASLAKPVSSLARDAFFTALEGSCVRSIPASVPCLSGHAHLRFPGVSAESMLILLDRMGVSASSGAACSSGSIEPSHVLLAAGYSEQEAKEGLRFTFGRATTVVQAQEAARRVIEAARSILKAE